MASSYEDFLRRAEATRVGVAAEADAAIGADEAARRERYRRRYGVEAPNPAEEAAAEARAEAERAAAASRRVASFASGTSNLALIRGNMDNMVRTAQTFEQQPPREGFFDAIGSFFSQTFGGEDSNGNNVWRDDINLRGVGRSLAAGTLGLAEMSQGLVQATAEDGVPILSDIAAYPTQLIANITGVGYGQSLAGQFEAQRRVSAEGVAQLRPRAKTQAGAAIYQGFESLPLAAVALAGGASVAGARTAAVLTASGIAGAGTAGQSYGAARDAGLNPEDASGYALRDGLIEAGTEALPFSELLPGASGGFLARVGRSLVEDVVGEQAATFLQDLNRFTTIEQGQGATWDDFWAARGPAAFDALFGAAVGTSTMGAATGALQFAANKMGRKVAAAATVDSNTSFFERLNQLAQADAVLTRDVGTFEAFVAHAAEGTAAETVFIDAAELMNVLDQSGLTGEQVAEAFNYTPTDIAMAVQRGDDIAIPVEVYAAHVAPTPLSEKLLPHLRLNPDDMSFTQAQTFLQGAKEEFAADAERALEQELAGNDRAASRDNVRQAMLQQLGTAGRFTEQTNEVYASVYAAFADTQGAKLGLTAEEFAQRYPLFVQSGEVAQATYDQPEGQLEMAAKAETKPKGDGRRFRDFFAGITRGESGAPDTRNTVRLFDTSGVAEFEQEYTRHMGRFDDHIGASIPGFREVQIAVGAALAETMPQNGRMLDIAGSEGALAKAIAARRPDVETVVLDPNPGMRDTFGNVSQVPNARFVMEAFTDTAADQGQQLWDEDGVPILGYTPDGQFDVVHEAMGFQFIHNDRAVQVARVKQLMTENGIAIFEEKFVPGEGLTQDQWQANEDVKDEFKLQYFNIQDLEAKKAAILEGKVEEQRTVGMNDLMVSPGEFERVLASNFRYAAQFWDSGNFKGYVGSDSREALDAFLSSLLDTTTPFSTVQTPRVVASPEVFNQDPVAQLYANSATLAGHNPTSRYMIARNATEDGYDRGQEADARTAGQQPGVTLDVARAAFGSGGVFNAQIELFPGVDLGTPPDPAVTEDYIDVDGEERPTRNADGELIAATESAVRNFWRWFGDSQMVDTDGRPIVFYHGTKANLEQGGREDFAFSTGYTSTFFFSIDRRTAEDFIVSVDKDANLIRAYLRAESVDKYDAGGRMWSEVLEIEEYILGEAEEAWMDAEMEAFEPESRIVEGDAVWTVYDGNGATVGTYDDEQDALDALDETIDNEREMRRDSLRYETPLAGELVELGFLEREGYSTDHLAAEAMGRYDAVLIDDVDEGSGATTVAIILGDPTAVKATQNMGGWNPEDPRIFYQEDPRDALDLFKRESFYPSRAVRFDDGTVYADIPDFYPDRQARLAEALGVAAVVSVPAGDARLEQGVPLWHSRPPLNADGTVTLHHWGPEGVATTDPTRWGESGTLPASERSAISSGLPRTYFGIASGQPGGYIIEFPGRNQYEARVPAERLYDVAADPDGLKPAKNVNELERKIAAAGYLGYWTADPQLGLVATVFEPLPVQPAKAQVMFQDAVFFSALERALEANPTTKAPPAQWIATLKKTPGIKEEELEWTGLLEFLEMQDRPVTRDQLLEVVRGAGIRVDEVVLGGREERTVFEEDGEWYVSDAEEAAYGPFATEGEARQTAAEFGGYAAANPQFSQWTTDPQNETYRELLFTLPVGEGRNPNRAPSTHWDTDGVIAHARFMDKTDADGKKVLFIEEVQSDWHQKGRDQGYAQPQDMATVEAAQRAYVEAKMAEDAASEALGARMGEVWQERFDAIEDPNLRQVFADAMGGQPGPDWSYNELTRSANLYRQDAEVERLLMAANAARLRTIEAGQRNADTNALGRGIPNAPFRTDWPALVMKRMIRWAAEHGYERIAWTTGEQQAKRYNLSQATGAISARAARGPMRITTQGYTLGPPVEGEYEVQTANRDALLQVRQAVGAQYGAGDTVVLTEAQLKEVFGATVAQKLIDGVREGGGRRVDEAIAAGGENRWQGFDITLEGDDLTVGGEGMKQFYDRNLVNITNKLVKKYGAKVGVVALEVEDGPLMRADLAVQRAQAAYDAEKAMYGSDLAVTPAARKALEEAKAKAEAVRQGEQQWGLDITPELADAAMGGFPLFQRERGPRGQIAFGNDITSGPSVITLLRGADLSTFVHELGHYFFEVTNHMASQAGAPAEVVADRDAMLRYLGVESITEWENRTPAQRREGHERMARSFEAYLFEGRAPSIELRGMFSKLRSWMMQVYRTITRLNVELTDEVRGVFDRMLASEDAIREAEADAEMQPLFMEKPAGMNDAEWEEYNRLDRDATGEAAKALEARSLRDMRYAGKATARELKRLQREVADQRAAVREEVVAEMERLPVYQAISLFRTGKLDGVQFEGPAKLNTKLVREALQLDDAPLPDAFKGMTNPDGVHPQQMAELFGYSSPNHMLNDVLFASPFNDAVEAETDSRMRERYGEVNTPQELEEAARAAVHNEVRGRFVATELAALQNAPGKRRALATAARTMADGIIARLRIRDLRPSKYEAAERRAAREIIANGTQDIDAAIRLKRNQLLQFYLAKSAHAAREEAQDAVRYLKKFDAKGTRENIDRAYLDQIDQVLEAFDLRQVSNRESDRRKSLADWVKQMEEQGFEPAFDAETLELIQRKPWRELTVEEMRGVVDAVRNIEHLGRLTKKLLTAKDKADLAEAAAEMAEAVRVNATQDVEPIIGAKTWWEKVQAGANDFFAMHRKIANTVYVFDGNRYGGVFWERFIRPMNEAGNRETTMTREANLRLAELFRPLVQDNTTRREFEPAIGKSLSLEDRIMVALNMGNAANLQRLMDGDGWTYEQVQAIVAPLTAAHWDFVEGVWREIDSWWPQIAAKQLRVTGVAPEKVEATPFQIEIDGQLRYIPGGYFPIKYDTDRSSKADADEAAAVLKQMTQGLYTSAQTRRGHTKERVDEVKGRPLRKDFGVIFQHTGQVIHDLAWHEYLIDANRLLKHKAIDSAIRDHYGPQTLRWMRKALEDIAVGDLPAQSAFEKSIRHIRTGVSIASMGWSFWTSLLQPVGLTQSIARIGARHVARGVGDLFSNPAKMDEKVEWVYSVSPFMRDRSDTMQREINEIRNKIGAKSPLRAGISRVVPESVASAVGDSYFYMLGKAQLVADLPTWLGQYHKSVEAGEPQDRAVALADQAVIDSQSSGQIKDLAGIQRGGELMRLFTNFYSYFSATYNLMADRTTQFRRVGAADLPFFMVDMAMLSFVPATITSLMFQLLRGGEDDEDWLAMIAKDNLQYMLGLMVGVREIGSALAGAAGYQGPAGVRFFAELGRFGKQAAQGEADEALVRAGNSTAGILLHYPAVQLDRTVRGVIAYGEGDAGPQAVVVGPPAGS